MAKSETALPNICWVTRPKELDGDISEADDLCRECAEKRVREYRQQFPQYAEFIFVSGGDCIRESDFLAACCDCDCCLACAAYEADGEVVETQEEWNAMRQKLDGES